MKFTRTFKDGSTPHVAIIGAGPGGMCTAIQLQRKLSLTTYRIYEKHSDIGGTWHANTYPGCASDNLAHLYHYSFAPNYNWSSKYVEQAEIVEYLKDTAKTYNLYDKITFHTKIIGFEWTESKSKWLLRWVNVLTGETGQDEADIIVNAMGLVDTPYTPKIFEKFTGHKWHTATWNHSVDLSDKCVGVVGVGASAVQVIPVIAPKVKKLVIYGRSPAYVTPMFNGSYSSTWKFLFMNIPCLHAVYVTLWYYILDLSFVIYNRLSLSSAFHRTVLSIMMWILRTCQIPDPELRAKVMPPHAFGVRRSILSNTYYKSLSGENVEYHREQIRDVEGNTITLVNGETRQLDVLVLATGFSIGARYPPGAWIGRNGWDVGQDYAIKPSSYYGVCFQKVPNCFLIWGPLSGSYHQSITSITESQVMFIIKAVSMMMEEDFANIEIKGNLVKDFTRLATQQSQEAVKFDKEDSSPSDAKAGILGPVLWNGHLTGFRWAVASPLPQKSDLDSSAPYGDNLTDPFTAPDYLASTAVMIMIIANSNTGTYQSSGVYFLVWFLVGIVGACVSFYLWHVGIILTGAYGMFVLVAIVFTAAKVTSFALRYTILAIFLVIGGFLTYRYERTAVIIATSFGGAYSIMFGLDMFVQTGFRVTFHVILSQSTERFHPVPGTWVMIAFVPVIAILGIIWELKHHEEPVGSWWFGGGARPLPPLPGEKPARRCCGLLLAQPKSVVEKPGSDAGAGLGGTSGSSSETTLVDSKKQQRRCSWLCWFPCCGKREKDGSGKKPADAVAGAGSTPTASVPTKTGGASEAKDKSPPSSSGGQASKGKPRPDVTQETIGHTGFHKVVIQHEVREFSMDIEERWAVQENMFKWHNYAEENPDRWIRVELKSALIGVRSKLAEYLHCNADELVVVPNTTFGINSILRSIKFEPGDRILHFSTGYLAVNKAVRYVCDVHENVEPIEVPVVLPMTDDEIVQLVEKTILDYTAQNKGTRVRLAVIDWISSVPTIVHPIKALTDMLKSRGVLVFVDGAHAVGQVPVDLSYLNADFLISSCHKWLYSVRGSAVLYVAKQHQSMIHPVTIQADYKLNFQDEFAWPGTLDFSTMLSIEGALDFRKQYGEDSIMSYSHKLALEGGRVMSEVLGTNVLTPYDHQVANMVNVRLPIQNINHPKIETPEYLIHYLLDNYNLYSPTFKHGGYFWTRVSAQIYLELSDFERLGHIWKEVIKKLDEEIE
ncbi:hypothetical protein BGW38_010925 [Lunasporangiospora selenospora]|uniref:Uncharacterized protein n=1 Tax=Lunasporangiospora selenospora TaxID=979761 RepID=A0A9P6FW29_9FUNG|nr:hypothetical protein BGW38_010925 [Lunasporangiospora selenospora]